MTQTSTMIAVDIREPGGPEVLTPGERELPEPRRHEVLVKVAAAGVNRPDCLQRRGVYPVPPDADPLPGLEIAGEVVALGEDADRWRTGDAVCALVHGGGYAEYCRVHQDHCLPVPQGLDLPEAAALPETVFTVYYNVFTRARLAPDETLLVHGGSSGIGTAAIQMAKAHGAKVLTTAGTGKKCDYCRELGADLAVNYKTGDWPAEVAAHVGEHGVDVVLDMVAGPYVQKNIGVLGKDGRYALIAFLLGPRAEIDLAPVLRRRLTLSGSALRPQSTEEKAAIAADVERVVWPWIEAGRMTPKIYRTFPLTEAAEAHRLMERSEHMGKIVLLAGD